MGEYIKTNNGMFDAGIYKCCIKDCQNTCWEEVSILFGEETLENDYEICIQVCNLTEHKEISLKYLQEKADIVQAIVERDNLLPNKVN